ncbi:MAG TPA: hypothetical protein VN706_21075 [Gemmatimonadaceae bacterium]|nr:hypothetical protein [Gemmatimonadaceae bacterium]
MALTVSRWLLVTVLACAFIWFGALFRATPPAMSAPEIMAPREWEYRGSPAAAMEGQLARANGRLRSLELRDSLLQAARNLRGPQPIVMLDPKLSEVTRQRLLSAIQTQWARLHITTTQPTVIAVVLDTLEMPHGLPVARSLMPGTPIEGFLPDAATQGVCVSMAHVRGLRTNVRLDLDRIIARLITSPETIDALLNPCALYAEFGMPSRTVQRWMFDTRWAPARIAAWNEESAPWRGLSRSPMYGRQPDWQVDNQQDQLRALVTPAGVACIAGEPGACQRILFSSRASGVDSAWRSHVVTSFGSSVSSFYGPVRRTPLGPSDGLIVSDMVHTLGHDRFARFWHSPLPAVDAFKQASGEDVDAWLRAWARRMYGSFDIGPTVSIVGLATGVLVAILGLGGAVLIERKRRVA